jgi:cob(I)alamin adenosyltransferase
MQSTKGYIHVYTGNGKGKTTAALGLALRATKNGYSVAFLQFMKYGGERLCAEHIGVTTYQSFGKNHVTDGWYAPRKPSDPYPPEITAGWDFTQAILVAGAHDLVILDEINVALAYNFIAVDQVIKALRDRPHYVEVVCTGRGAPAELIAIADLVTDLTEVKHMYHAGIPARKGIDF